MKRGWDASRALFDCKRLRKVWRSMTLPSLCCTKRSFKTSRARAAEDGERSVKISEKTRRTKAVAMSGSDKEGAITMHGRLPRAAGRTVPIDRIRHRHGGGTFVWRPFRAFAVGAEAERGTTANFSTRRPRTLRASSEISPESPWPIARGGTRQFSKSFVSL